MKKEVFVQRRNKLIEKLENGSLLVLFSGKAPQKSGDEDYPFTPNRNFFYLTGVAEQNDALLIFKNAKGTVKEIFFNSEVPDTVAKWIGQSFLKDEIEKLSGTKEIYHVDKLEETIEKIFKDYKVKKVYLDFEQQPREKAPCKYKHFAKVLESKHLGIVIEDIFNKIAELRMIKDKYEIEEIRKAIHITKLGIDSFAKKIAPKVNERSLANLFQYTILENGASDLAFDTIAAANINSCTLHYRANNTDLGNSGVILFDLGAEYNYYKADISRTFPIGKKFSDREATIYNLVRKVQDIVFNAAKPGLTIRNLNEMVVNFYQEELTKLGLLENGKTVRDYYMHSVSHHLGLDTHDSSIRDTILAPGMVITVEPGLYIEDEEIGVRIEDDILITKKGCEILSKEIASNIKDIEAMRK